MEKRTRSKRFDNPSLAKMLVRGALDGGRAEGKFLCYIFVARAD
jgi:hypothetical protein